MATESVPRSSESTVLCRRQRNWQGNASAPTAVEARRTNGQRGKRVTLGL